MRAKEKRIRNVEEVLSGSSGTRIKGMLVYKNTMKKKKFACTSEILCYLME